MLAGAGILAALVILAFVLYVAVRSFHRWLAVRKRRDALDHKLREWQQTKSLEDLERHRRRLEGNLDEMHESWRDRKPGKE